MSYKFWFILSLTFLILTLSPRVSYSSNVCGSLFTDEGLKSNLEKILLKEQIMDDVTEVRRKYDGHSERSKMGATVQLLAILDELTELPYQNLEGTQLKTLEIGIDNLLVDLAQVSPRYIQTERLMTERIAIIVGMLAAERFKSSPLLKSDNVVLLSGKKIKDNSEYLGAQRVLYQMIDSYQSQNYIPRGVIVGRIDELLRSDLRVQTLSIQEQEQLANLIANAFYGLGYPGSEVILEKYFKSRGKERML